MKKIIISSLLGVMLLCSSVHAQALTQKQMTLKEQRVNTYKKAKDTRSGFQPYRVIQVKAIESNHPVLQKLKKLQGRLDSLFLTLIKNVVNNAGFKVMEKQILLNPEDSKCFRVETLVDLLNKKQYENFYDLIGQCKKWATKYLNSDLDLYEISIYSGNDEVNIVELYFPDKKSDCYNRNPIPLRVLTTAFNKKTVAFNGITKIGFSENKYQYTLAVPLIFKTQYLGDIQLNYLKSTVK